MNGHVFSVALAVALFLAGPGTAAPAKPDAVAPAAAAKLPQGAKLHRAFKDRGAADRFVELLGVKQATLTQIEVLQSLIREKQEELRRFNEGLTQKFGIDATGDYEFSAESGAILQLRVVTNAAKGASAATNAIEKKLVRKLDKKADIGDFVRVAAARNMTREEIAAFTMVVAEKNLELQQCDKKLLDDYGISNKSAYQYVAGDMAVYELPASGTGVTGPGATPVPK